jgi:copper homeostasis protein
VELCAALGMGGLTPSVGLMRRAADYGLPCYPMIRPRAGDFCFTMDEVAVMLADIGAAQACGLTGVVLGANLPDGRLDREVLARLIEAAGEMNLTLHRAVDLTPDVTEAVEVAIDLGFRRILSSGGARVAVQGLDRLAQMISVAAGRLSVMPGSGVSVQTWPQLASLGVTEVHASCAAPLPAPSGLALEFGFVTGQEKRTDRALVAALKRAMSGRPDLDAL